MLFSLLALSGVPMLLAACGGAAVAVPPDATPSASLRIVARDNRFDQRYLVVSAGSESVITLDNEDRSSLHNFAVYRDKGAKQLVYRGEVFEGKREVENRLPALEAGSYYFRCDVHPDMNGTLLAK